MGNSNSFEQNVSNYSANLSNQHTDLDLSMKRIEAEADRIIGIILMRKYNDRDALCKQIAYHKVDELQQFFKTETLDGVRYRLGVTSVPQNATLERNRQNACRDIVNFYLKKINLITNIQKEVPNCLNMEQEIYRNLTQKLENNRLNNQDSLAVYEKLEKFNKDIKKRYDLIEREIERIRLAKNMTELDAIARTTNTILSDTNKICKIHENELFQYSDRAEQLGVKRNVEVAGDLRREADRQQSFLASYAIPPDVQQTVISPLSPVVSPRTYVAPIPLSPQRTIVSPLPPIRTFSPPTVVQNVVSSAPVVRTVVSPAPVVRTVVSPAPVVSPRRIVQPTVVQQREVRHIIQEYPVHERIVRRPITVSQEFIDEKPAVVVPPPVPVVPVPVAVPVVETSIPVAKFPEVQPRAAAVVATKPRAGLKEVRVRADSIRRVGNTIHVRNPSMVNVTHHVPKEIEVSRVIEPRAVRVERTVLPRKAVRVDTVVKPVAGVPVKAVKSYDAKTPNELSIRVGEPLTYLGSSANGWSRIRNHGGVEGYIPHGAIGR